jgi:hypothetical protein
MKGKSQERAGKSPLSDQEMILWAQLRAHPEGISHKDLIEVFLQSGFQISRNGISELRYGLVNKGWLIRGNVPRK